MKNNAINDGKETMVRACHGCESGAVNAGKALTLRAGVNWAGIDADEALRKARDNVRKTWSALA